MSKYNTLCTTLRVLFRFRFPLVTYSKKRSLSEWRLSYCFRSPHVTWSAKQKQRAWLSRVASWNHIATKLFVLRTHVLLQSTRDNKLTGRVRAFPARNGSLAGRASMTRGLFFADPRVGPAHSARGCDTWNTSRSLTQRFISYKYSKILLWY